MNKIDEQQNNVDFDAPKLNGIQTGTFVYETIKDRWPKIVGKLIDHYHCNRRVFMKEYGDEADADVKAVIHSLSEMRYRMMTDKPLENIVDDYEDVTLWNDIITYLIEKKGSEQVSWYREDWLFVECYLYRKIYSAICSTRHLRNYDYFGYLKRDSLLKHMPQIEDAASHFMTSILVAPFHDAFGFSTIIQMALWGNRADLSLSGADEACLNGKLINQEPSHRNNFLLVDDCEMVLNDHLLPLKKRGPSNRRIDIILDNAGVELFSDLILAEYLLSFAFADKIVLHGKAFPWFVSDVTKEDLSFTISELERAGEFCSSLQQRLEEKIKNGQIEFKAHAFWTYPYAYFEMANVAPDLYEDLKSASFAFFKGDLNYRKLVGDRSWNYDTPFKTALQGFKPCPFLTLRTLKAETCVGLSKTTIFELEAEMVVKQLPSNNWLVTGEYAVCQLGGV